MFYYIQIFHNENIKNNCIENQKRKINKKVQHEGTVNKE